MIKIWIGIITALILPWNLVAQKTQVFQESQFEFKRGMDFYEKELYALAQHEFEKSKNRLITPADHQTQVLKTQAEMMYALSSVRMEQPHGEQLVMAFVRENKGTIMADRALYDLGNYYYAKKDYEKSSEAFAEIDGSGLSPEQMAEVRFKQGYGHFVKQRFAAAKTAFAGVRQANSEYYHPANYYYGMSSFYLKQYRDAVNGFKAAAGNKRYANQVPVFITQIHFSQKEYDEVITYGTSVLADPNVQRKIEIGHLVGQAYFEKGEYQKALPYLNEYADRNTSMSESEFYQVAYANYIAGNCEKAIQYFRRSANANNEMGQLSNYYLGECFLKNNDRPMARSAFSKASTMEFRQDIKEDATFQLGKLLTEMRADREAVQLLLKFGPQSNYYAEAQNLITEILKETSDYDFAISVIDRLPNKSQGINEAYQKAAYNKAVSLHEQKLFEDALSYFEKSLQYPINASLKAMATFWKGDILHQQKKYEASIKELNQFILLEKTVNLPQQEYLYLANYIQGYNHLKKNDHQNALGYFEKAIEGIRRNQSKINDPLVKVNIFGDAILRAGDCHFKRNRYREANRFYNEAVANKYSGYDYALFQKALISGLEKNYSQKISQLEELVKTLPNSAYADDALYELSFVYEAEGKVRQSKEALEKLVRDYKNSNLVNAAYLKLGLLHYNAGDKLKALEHYKLVFKNNPSKEESDAALKAIEEIYVVDLGKPDDYFKFLESIPGYQVRSDARDSITFRVAQAQYENGNYERAIAAYTDYLNKYPKGGYALQAHYNRGESHLILKNYSAALKDYEFLVAQGQNPYYLRALEKAAIIAYNHANDFKKSLDYYTKLEELASNSEMKFEAQLGAMRSAYRSANQGSTLLYADKVINNNLARPDQKALAHYYKGKIAHQKAEWSKAISSFKYVIEQLNNELAAESNYLIATAYFELKDYKRAESEAKEVLENYAGFRLYVAKSLILLSDIFMVQNDLISARAALEAVIENFDDDPEVLKEAQSKLKKVKESEDKNKKSQSRGNQDEIDFKDFNRN